ncbi:ICE-like protease (caspase) p20 domain protein [Ceratobasidium sp. AG-Ba]|nr:ICE-like protease (caspase) p20 domain protein [Ceratobasidium sp. AG-Ba]QRW13610.1 ICE-like protease (caspase) p20 domain protein [Ceratobasidium sp. AG-Ba]
MRVFTAANSAFIVAVSAAPEDLFKRATVLSDGFSVHNGALPDWNFQYYATGYLAKGGCPVGSKISTCYVYTLSGNPSENVETNPYGSRVQNVTLSPPSHLADGQIRQYTFRMEVDPSLAPTSLDSCPLVAISIPGEDGGSVTPVYLDVQNNLAGIYAFTDTATPSVSMPLKDFTGKSIYQTWTLKSGPGDPDPDEWRGEAEEESILGQFFGVAKSLLGVTLSRAPRPSFVALIFTNRYKGIRENQELPFDKDQNNAELPGSVIDCEHSSDWTRRVFPGIEVIEVPNAIKNKLDETHNRLGAYIHLQGHFWDGIYVTAQMQSDGTIEGLDAKEMLQILNLTQHLSWRLIVTDVEFCYSGNCFLLQFFLDIEGEEPEWKETPNWRAGRRTISSTPIIHFAGSTEDQPVFEGDQMGGFFTYAIKEEWDNSLTLPEQLKAIRECVHKSVEEAKKEGQISPESSQTPQLFSSVRLDLDTTHTLIKLRGSV